MEDLKLDLLGQSIQIANAISKLRKRIPKEVQIQLNCFDSKIEIYLKRAFVRWIFNSIRHGKNPFLDKITSQDFVSDKDMTYLFTKNEQFNRFITTPISWVWLDECFFHLHEISHRDDLSHIITGSKIDVFQHKTCVIIKYTSSKYTSSKYTSSKDVYFKDDDTDKTYNLPLKQYTCACEKYTGPTNYLNIYLMILLSRYEACGSTNNHCSVPPHVIQYCGAKTELFGSVFNTYCEQYCSPFVDIEKHFGSLGSFFSYQIGTGTYLMNPPYDEEFMQDAAEHVVNCMKTPYEISIIVVIPLWDPKSQEQVRGRVHVDKKFKALEILNESGFVRSQTVLYCATHKFYDYYTDKTAAVADAHLLVLTNTDYKLTANDISAEWLRCVK